jgi:hypothetical protein
MRKLVSLLKIRTSIEDVKVLRIILGSTRTEVGKRRIKTHKYIYIYVDIL